MANSQHLDSDVFFDVLSWLPAKTLVGLKRVSKGWRSLISNRSFVRAQQRKTKLQVSGFIFQQRFQWSNQDFKTVSYISLDNGDSRVHQSVFDFLPDDVVALASCKGLVCCRSCFPTRDPAIFICNPLTKEWLTLPGTQLDKESNIALAFDPEKVNAAGTNFKLVRVQELAGEVKGDEEDETRFTFEVFRSSGAPEWKSASEVCRCNNQCSLKNNGVYIAGTLYWQTDGDKILTFRVENELSWMIPVPIPAGEFRVAPQACIGESGGKLHYAMVSEEGLHLWCLEDCFECEWALRHGRSLEALESDHPRIFRNLRARVLGQDDYGVCDTPWVNPLAFVEGLLLILVSTKIYLLEFESGKMEEVCEASELASCSTLRPTVLPYAMSLMPLSAIDE